MTDFKKLKTPYNGHSGWYLATLDEPVAWLTTNGNITSSTDDMSILFFDTELEAYEAAKTYYSRHTMYYPHELALNALRYGIKPDAKVDTNESQVMEFE